MNTISIRYAEPTDASCIARLSRQTFYDTFVDFNTKEDMDKFMQEQFTVEALEREVVNGDGIFFLAEEGTEALGYVRMREGDQYEAFKGFPSIEIARIYVDKKAIGKGIGKLLMDQCIEVARQKQKAILWLGVWERNERAIQFYTKAGFFKFGTHDFLLGNDLQTDWLMMKHL